MEDRDPLSLLKSVREDLQTVQRKVDYLVAGLDSSVGSESIPKPSGVGEPLNLPLVNHALQQMVGQQSQEEILSVLLANAGQCAGRVILFDVEAGKLQAWKGVGIASDLLTRVTVSETDSPLMEAAQTGKVVTEEERISERIPWLTQLGPLPKSCLCVPLAFGSFVPLVLYADSAAKTDSGSIALLVRLAILHMQNHYLAHLLHKGEGTEAPSEQDEGTASTDRESLVQEPEASAGGSWEGSEQLEREDPRSMLLTDEEEEAAHAEARRLARLLVAEIKLYNEEDVEEGRRSADLYRRLRTDIDRSRRMYEKRVHPMVKFQADYFGAEMIRVLARGDVALLGNDYEEPELSNPIHQDSL